MTMVRKCQAYILKLQSSSLTGDNLANLHAENQPMSSNHNPKKEQGNRERKKKKRKSKGHACIYSNVSSVWLPQSKSQCKYRQDSIPRMYKHPYLLKSQYCFCFQVHFVIKYPVCKACAKFLN
ncbi:hypothetical protein CDL12_18833 [Handroanthus impetiginosus]|uniref:Uncharacterized protein n=1 Tax=Handroanthus impetiginosus TaxID=429701 RepID=A0A2G9GTH7_9LAMI|nr:hypothetical protein CDL12_18833 [Handroanthus impetiginosus]